ncbi:MAG: LysE family translocator [Bacteroides sp.]|nr:LysE family translocator [Bacteroides sp.]
MDFLESLIYVIWRGIAIGVIISAPMGPVGILCVQRTLEKGRRAGFFTGLGAAVSDLFYCLLTGFGLSFIEEFLNENQNVIQIVGSLVLVLFGVYLFRSNPARSLKKPGDGHDSRGKFVLSGFLFTFSNPLIIFLIIGLFARFNFMLPDISFLHYIVGFICIFGGALMWWWIVTFFIDKVRSHFNLRSMWLINRITGVIIMIFAVVGVVTAVRGIASAAGPQTICFNSGRGFGSLRGPDDDSKGQVLTLSAVTSDTVFRFLPLDSKAEEFSFSFRCANLNNMPGKKYAFTDSTGKVKKSAHVPWGLVFKGENGKSFISFSTLYDRFDDISPSGIEVQTNSRGEVHKYIIPAGMDLFTGFNSFRLSVADGRLTLLAGNRRYNPVPLEMTLGRTDSIGFWTPPGGKIEIDDIVLDINGMRSSEDASGLSHFANPDVRNSYFSRSADSMEGVWEMFDVMLDESSLRSGGSYRVAIVKNKSGYDIIFLDGAKKLESRWKPGMTKGTLSKTPFPGVFNVEWLDPAGRPLRGEIKAQLESPGILAFKFPEYGGSNMRLRKIRE